MPLKKNKGSAIYIWLTFVKVWFTQNTHLRDCLCHQLMVIYLNLLLSNGWLGKLNDHRDRRNT